MSWLKRNLFLVVGGVVALAMLGAAAFFLWTQYQREAAVSGEVEQAIEKFKSLIQRRPSVLQENIEAAKGEQKRLQGLLEDQQKFFAPFCTLTNIDSAEFKGLLETTIDELQKMAQRQGVRTPNKFSYTFPSQRETMVFDPPDLLPWTYQLMEIKALCTAIYDARVHTLASLRRAPATKKDVGWYTLGRRSVTNAAVGSIVTPYEVVLHGFTTEIATVLQNLIRSQQCFVVKNINVERLGASLGADDSSSSGYTTGAGGGDVTYAPVGVPAQPFGGAAPSMQDTLRRRYGIGPGGRGPGAPPAAGPAPVLAAPAAAAPRRPETVLDEKLLKITMLVEAVRFKDTPK